MKNSFLEKFEIGMNCALLVVDMQYDFLPGGALAVLKGDEIIEPINEIIELFFNQQAKVIFTQDWHPIGHRSFASTHLGKKPYDPISLPGIGPVLWPDHCIQNTHGADIHKSMRIERAIAIIRKGYNPYIDSYSAFIENDLKTKTGLAGFLHGINITTVFICGLATDYCCFYSAIDGKIEGFDIYFIEDLTRGIDSPKGNIEKTRINMQQNGIHIIKYRES